VKKILFLFFIFFTSISKSQIIKGTINDSHGNKISLANIFFKKEKKSNEFEEFTVAKNGYFEHTLKKNMIVFTFLFKLWVLRKKFSN
jgi:hypothetical protein